MSTAYYRPEVLAVKCPDCHASPDDMCHPVIVDKAHSPNRRLNHPHAARVRAVEIERDKQTAAERRAAESGIPTGPSYRAIARAEKALTNCLSRLVEALAGQPLPPELHTLIADYQERVNTIRKDLLKMSVGEMPALASPTSVLVPDVVIGEETPSEPPDELLAVMDEVDTAMNQVPVPVVEMPATTDPSEVGIGDIVHYYRNGICYGAMVHRLWRNADLNNGLTLLVFMGDNERQIKKVTWAKHQPLNDASGLHLEGSWHQKSRECL